MKGDTHKLPPELLSPYNFMKHADRDPDGKINIAPLVGYTSDFIMDAIQMLQGQTPIIPIEAKVYWEWFVSSFPDQFSDKGELGEMKKRDIASWDFESISDFIKYSDIVADIPLDNED